MLHTNYLVKAFLFLGTIWSLFSCSNEPASPPAFKIYYNDFAVPPMDSSWTRFAYLFQKDTNYLNEFELTTIVPHTYYKDWQPAATLPTRSKMITKADLEVHFYPLDQDTAKQFQYIHKYNCVYDPKNYYFADIAYPNPCAGKDKKAKGKAVFVNKSNQPKTMKCRLFYQNTSYWYPTSIHADFTNRFFLSNYYGGSQTYTVTLGPNETKEVYLEYVIGKDPKKNEWATKKYYGAARSGAYEFMLWASEDASDLLIQDTLDYTKVNPFAYVQERLMNSDFSVNEKFAHLHSTHFKFITLMETFDGDNIYNPGDVYMLSDRDQKPLCDTCNGYFKDVISEEWTLDDYFKGFISKAPMIKAEYGNRKENVRIDQNGIYLKCPGSTPEKKQKTWGEVKFAPGFLYGTVKIVAKLSQLRNAKGHTPTGIVHNLWLYEFNHPYADPIPNHPYKHLVNSNGKQPYEIDIEIWSKIYDENWNGGSSINYSIVDYMRYADAVVKPGEAIEFEGNKIDRLNLVQLNYPGQELLQREFFDQYHLYEISWTPHDVIYKIDGKQTAKIDWRMAKIPDEYAFLWIGSPIYQDGTYYSQTGIPFLPSDRFTHIRYISIE